jgi:hypothetical protein
LTFTRSDAVAYFSESISAGHVVKLSWHFSKVNPRFKNREATQGEFFSNDTELRAFIREAVQNSLDARRPGYKGPVSVRLYVSGHEGALEPAAAKRYFRGGWDHFHAEGSGLREAPGRDDACPFITYEDSGTTGLTGDTEQFHEVPGVRNPFYYFFRAEGQSNKLEAGRGRWGLGKFVFPRSSAVRSFFGLTVRHDDHKRLLVGQAILRSHHVEDKNYTPDGWFGERPDKDEAWAPVDDSVFIDQFESDFCLERKREPGLSLVVPFCDTAWTVDAVIESVLQDYFYVILRDELVVTVENSTSTTVMNARTLPGIAASASEVLRAALLPLFELSRWALTAQPVPLTFRTGPGSVKWDPKAVSSEDFATIRREFHEAGRVALSVPIDVQHRQGVTRPSQFQIYLERFEGSLQKRPMFIRDGIIISDVRSRLIRDVHAIVAVDHPSLTEFLGDAENPAHTEWHEESSHFKGKYLNGAATLRFVRNSVADLCQMLTQAGDDEDPELLLDVFSVGTSGSDAAGGAANWPVQFSSMTTRSSEAEQTNDQRLHSLKAKPRRTRTWRLTRREGGFRISGRPMNDELNCGIEILVAYDRRSGSALRKYSTTDFELGQLPVEIDARGAVIEIPEPNRLIVYPDDESFDVTVTGFDKNRDLFLQARFSKHLTRIRSVRDEMFVE